MGRGTWGCHLTSKGLEVGIFMYVCVGNNDKFAETRVCTEKSWEIQQADGRECLRSYTSS